MLDLLDVSLGEASGSSVQTDPWGIPITAPPPRPQVSIIYQWQCQTLILHDNTESYHFCMMRHSLWIYLNIINIRYVEVQRMLKNIKHSIQKDIQTQNNVVME